jgi:hypothetical protein
MGCRKGWSRDVLDSFCLITWLDKDYKHHRQTVLVDRERSRLPAAQLVLERMKEAEKRKPILDDLIREYNEVKALLDTISLRITEEAGRINALKRGETIDVTSSGDKKETEKRAFVMQCPSNDCRGFLSSAYKCGVCEMYTCPDCREVKGDRKDSPHTCDPNSVESVRALKKECKPCPDCGVNIFRVSGCSQMFCTICHIAFDWGTGKKVVNGVIHNPHYYDYMRELNNGVLPRNPGDIPCGGDLPPAWAFARHSENLAHTDRQNPIAQNCYNALRTFAHIRHDEVPRLTNNVNDTDNTNYNIQYINGTITEKRWKQILQTREKRRMLRDEVRQRMEALCGAAMDVYTYYDEQMKTHGKKIIDREVRAVTFMQTFEQLYSQINKLRNMFNKELDKVSYRYRCQVPYIDETFLLLKQKAERTSSKKSGDSDDEE